MEEARGEREGRTRPILCRDWLLHRSRFSTVSKGETDEVMEAESNQIWDAASSRCGASQELGDGRADAG